MIRIPRHWTYYIIAIYCVISAFQKDNHLFSFVGISTSFNILARIGLLIYAGWFLLLGGRGKVISESSSTSSYRVSYASFHGGYKILWILFGLGTILLLLGLLT